MSIRTSLFNKAAALAVGLTALVAAGAAQAGGGVSWSVGISSPGMAVGVAPAPVYVQQPVYVQPQPVWQPTTIYSVPPVQYTQPAVVYPAGALVQPVVVQQAVPIHRGHHHHHHYWR